MAGIGFAAVPLLRGEIFFYWDNAHQHYPQTAFLSENLRSGVIPHWWPAAGNGAPIAAEGQAAHFQPLRLLLAWVLSPAAAMMLEIGIYLAVSGLGTFLLLRRFHLHPTACLLGGWSVMVGSLSVAFVRNMGLHRSLGLLPLVMLCAENVARRPSPTIVAIAALLVGFQLLSGHPTLTVITMIASTTHLALRLAQRFPVSTWHDVRQIPSRVVRPLIAWGAALSLGMAVAAIQFIPQLLHVGESIRAGGLTAEAASALPAMVRYLPQALLPYAYLQGDWITVPTPWSGLMNTTPSAGMYLGALAAVLPLAALRWHRGVRDPMWAFLAGLTLAMLLALGQNTPLFGALRALPGISGLRYPSRFLMWAAVCFGAVVAFGCHRVIVRGRLRRVRSADAAAIFGVPVAAAVVAAIVWAAREQLATQMNLAEDLAAGLAGSLLLLVIASGLVWSLLRVSPRRRSWLLVALVAFAVIDLLAFRHISGYAPTVPVSSIATPPPIAGPLAADRTQFRVMSLITTEQGLNRNEDLREFLQANMPVLWGLDSSDVWYSLFLKRHYAMREGIAWELAHNPSAARKLSSFLASWNVKYVIGPKGVVLDGWTTVYQTERATAWLNPVVMPRAFLVGHVVPEAIQVFPERTDRSIARLERYHQMAADWSARAADAQIVDNLLRSDVDFRSTAVVTGPDLPELTSWRPGRVVTVSSPRPDALEFDVESDGSALLVIATNFYPGWRATVDGSGTRIWRTNYTSMGVVVPNGRSRVSLTFVTPGFTVGRVVTVIAVVLCISMIILAHAGLRDPDRRKVDGRNASRP